MDKRTDESKVGKEWEGEWNGWSGVFPPLPLWGSAEERREIERVEREREKRRETRVSGESRSLSL